MRCSRWGCQREALWDDRLCGPHRAGAQRREENEVRRSTERQVRQEAIKRIEALARRLGSGTVHIEWYSKTVTLTLTESEATRLAILLGV